MIVMATMMLCNLRKYMHKNDKKRKIQIFIIQEKEKKLIYMKMAFGKSKISAIFPFKNKDAVIAVVK